MFRLAATISLTTSLALAGMTSGHASPRNAVLFSFDGTRTGASPSGLTADAAGVLYGTAASGGVHKQCYGGCGVVFRLLPPATPGGGWKEETVYDFSGNADGGTPAFPPVVDSLGNLYGTAQFGGDHPIGRGRAAQAGGGVVWELSPPEIQGGAWTFRVLHSFTGDAGGTDGAWPYGSLALSSNGVLYGATVNGGAPPRPAGTLYTLTPPAVAGGAWVETVLHEFEDGKGTGIGDMVALTGHQTELLSFSKVGYDKSGSILAVVQLTSQPPSFGRRAVIQDVNIYNGFLIDHDHDIIYSGVQQGDNGDVFMLMPPIEPGGHWMQTALHAFSAIGQLKTPNGPLVRNAAGTLFGTRPYSNTADPTADGSSGTLGSVFRLDPPAAGATAWTYTELHQFDGAAGSATLRPDGNNPRAGVVFGWHHLLYGTTFSGGRHGLGTIFEQTLD